MHENQNNNENEKKNIFSLKELWIIFWFWVFLWVVHNYLMYWFSNWIWTPIFTFIFLISIYIVSYLLNIKLNKNFYLISFTILILSIFKMIRVWSILNNLNTIGIFLLYILLFKIIIKEKFREIKAVDYFPWFIKTIFWAILWIWIWLWSLIKLWIKLPKLDNKVHIIKWILMSLPLIFVFSMLFSSADLVFNKILSNILDLNILDLFDFNWRVINFLFFWIIFIWIFTYIFFQIRTFSEKTNEKELVYDDKKHIEINIVLWLTSILFLVFVVLQIWYLFSSENFIISQWYTYSEYARKWFTELSFIAFIVFILLWKIDEYLYWHKKKSSDTYKILATILISLTILVLFSAIYRLWLYENAYGFTEIRFYGYIFIAILFSSLLVMLYKVLFFIDEWLFIIINLYFYLIGIIFSNIFNPEAFISNHNTNKMYRWSISTDFSYIWWMSSDAIDSMLSSYLKAKEEQKTSMEWQFCKMIEKLEEKNIDWRAYNYSNSHAYNLLLPMKTKFNCKNNNILR